MDRRLIRVRLCKSSHILESKVAPGASRIGRSDAIEISRSVITALGLDYLSPDSVTVDSEYVQGVGIPVGSIRRRRSDVGDIDVVVTSPISVDSVRSIRGAFNVYGGSKQINFTHRDGEISVNVNMYVFTDPETFGAALLHATGPSFYNMRLRSVAKSRGLSLSQNGLVDIDTGDVVAGRSEADVQRALGVKLRNPSER